MQPGDYVGRSERTTALIEPHRANAFCAILDENQAVCRPDAFLPPLWHWLYFPEVVRHSQLGSDGHPKRGTFFPPVPLRRRMYGSCATTITRPLSVGDLASQIRTIEAVERKEGASGPLVIVEVVSEVFVNDALAISEEQTIVYTDAVPAPVPPLVAVPDSQWYEDVATDSSMLFRFSAVTFNSHRIHYDFEYARDVEGYPGIVVQGPLLALLAARAAQRQGISIREFHFRARSPLYSGDAVHIRGTNSHEGGKIAVYGPRGLAMDIAFRSG